MAHLVLPAANTTVQAEPRLTVHARDAANLAQEAARCHDACALVWLRWLVVFCKDTRMGSKAELGRCSRGAPTFRPAPARSAAPPHPAWAPPLQHSTATAATQHQPTLAPAQPAAPDMGTALPPRHSTARESPAFATNRRSRTISATTAVQPACRGASRGRHITGQRAKDNQCRQRHAAVRKG